MKFSAPVWLITTLTIATTVSVGCAPAPRNRPCSNDGECRTLDEGYSYCLQSRCVRCVATSMCNPGQLCVDGECKQR
jgi:hypothetical protein